MEDRAPTLLDDASATAEPEVDEPKPPVAEAEDRDVEPPTTTTPLRRSKRLMMKKAKAAVAKPRRKKATPARLAGPPKAPSKKAAPSLSTRRSTRARSKPIRYTP